MDWRKIESRRLSCSFIARAASSRSLKVFGLTGATCEITDSVSGSTFRTAPQQGQVRSKAEVFDLGLGDAISKNDNSTQTFQRGSRRIGKTWNRNSNSQMSINRAMAAAMIASISPNVMRLRPGSK